MSESYFPCQNDIYYWTQLLNLFLNWELTHRTILLSKQGRYYQLRLDNLEVPTHQCSGVDKGEARGAQPPPPPQWAEGPPQWKDEIRGEIEGGGMIMCTPQK